MNKKQETDNNKTQHTHIHKTHQKHTHIIRQRIRKPNKTNEGEYSS